jgi:hypothetical protein
MYSLNILDAARPSGQPAFSGGYSLHPAASFDPQLFKITAHNKSAGKSRPD